MTAADYGAVATGALAEIEAALEHAPLTVQVIATWIDVRAALDTRPDAADARAATRSRNETWMAGQQELVRRRLAARARTHGQAG